MEDVLRYELSAATFVAQHSEIVARCQICSLPELLVWLLARKSRSGNHARRTCTADQANPTLLVWLE
jgi:hypothetical protein